MIKVDKDIYDVPSSLRVDEESIKKNPAMTTHKRRLEVNAAGSYPESGHSSNHDSRYKYEDIKTRLAKIYHKKCAFCESSAEQMHVEHFRPKRGGYYWLAFSWDNLLLACPICNINKGNIFPLSEDGVKAEFGNTDEENAKIHSLSSNYDKTERPLLINPESVTQDVLDEIHFGKDGSMKSNNKRCAKTIDQCQLDRQSLRQRRKVIWDELRRELHEVFVECPDNIEIRNTLILHVINSFNRKMNDIDVEYLAYRKYLMKEGWIIEELKMLNTK